MDYRQPLSISTGRLPVVGRQKKKKCSNAAKYEEAALAPDAPRAWAWLGLAWRLRPEENAESSFTSVICVAVGEGLRLAARHLGSGLVSPPSCCS